MQMIFSDRAEVNLSVFNDVFKHLSMKRVPFYHVLSLNRSLAVHDSASR